MAQRTNVAQKQGILNHPTRQLGAFYERSLGFVESELPCQGLDGQTVKLARG